VSPKVIASGSDQCRKSGEVARLTKPVEVLALLDALPDPDPFETLRDAFRAHADREHLNRLAPERRALVIELLKQLAAPGQDPWAHAGGLTKHRG
jgi:hypothetical protein